MKLPDLLTFVLCIGMLNLLSCSGCSKSGRAYQEEVSRRSSNRFSAEDRSLKKTLPKTAEKIDLPAKVESPKINESLSSQYNRLKNGVFVVYAQNAADKNVSQGSGFFVSSDVGVSNAHVFEGFEQYFIKTADGQLYKVNSILHNSPKGENDFVIFEIDTPNKKYPSLVLSSLRPQVGEDVFAIGNPHGLEHTLSTGIISGIRKKEGLIQTTTEITFGSSGSPLFNSQGEVIGITTSGLGEANINFAVDIQIIKPFI